MESRKEQTQFLWQDQIQCAALGTILVSVLVSGFYHLLAWGAWRAATKRMEMCTTHPAPLERREKGFSLVQSAPPVFGVEPLLQQLVRYPLYLSAFACTLSVYFPRALLRRFVFRQEFTDQNIWDLSTQTLLMLLCDVDATAEHVVYRGVPATKPIFPEVKAPYLDGSSLVVHMHNGKITSACTDAGPVEARGLLSRNELILEAMWLTLTIWLHPATHVAAEKSAGEIAQKKIQLLASSALFTHSLHQGLLHSPVSPGNEMPVLRSSIPPAEVWLPALKTPPPHNLHRIKGNLRYFKFYMQAHAILRRLVRKFELDVDVHNLFAAVIMHSLDHYALYDVLSAMPARAGALASVRGSNFLAMLENEVFTHMWLPPHWNLFYSEKIAHSFNPFYAQLYSELRRVDPLLAGRVWFSCSF